MLKELLDKLTYEEFSADLAKWLMSGRMVWGFFGNMQKAQCVDIAKSACKSFGLSNTERGDLPSWRVI